MRRKAVRIGSWGFLLAFMTTCALGQAQKPSEPQALPGDRMPAGERITGAIESVGIDRFVIKKNDGTTATILVDEQTRYRQRQQDIQLEDLKPGDHVFVLGRTGESKDVTARMVRRVSDEDRGRMPGPGEFVAGEIVSIDQGQIRLRTRRQGEKTVAINEQTEFRNSGRPASLKDLKVGDRIFVTGKESNGQFIATRVMSGQMQSGERWRERRENSEKGPATQ